MTAIRRYVQRATIIISMLMVMLVAACTSDGGNNPPGVTPPESSNSTVKLTGLGTLTLEACTDAPVTGLTAVAETPTKLIVHYKRDDGDYTGWGIHFWNSSGSPANTTGIEWNAPLMPVGSDDFGQIYEIPLQSDSGTIGYIFHKGDEKDHGGADQSYTLNADFEIWRAQNDAVTYPDNPIGVEPPSLKLRVHYQRGSADYDGWGLHVWNSSGSAADTTGIAWDAPLAITGEDDFGRYADIPLTATSGTIGYIFHKGDEKDHDGADQSYVLNADHLEIWRKQGDATTYTSNPDLIIAPDADNVRVHYKRYLGDYSGFGLHIWEISGGNDIDTARLPGGVVIGDWANAVPFAAPMTTGTDSYGVWIDVPVKKFSEGARGFNFLVHKGTDDAGKDGNDRQMLFANGYEIWLLEGDNRVHYSEPLGDVSMTDAKAFWIDRNTILWPRVSASGEYRLYFTAKDGMTINTQVNSALGSIALTVADSSVLSDEQRAAYQYIPQPYAVLQLTGVSDSDKKRLLRTQTILARRNDGVVTDATMLQTAGVLDDLYYNAASDKALGVVMNGGQPLFNVWAPTANQVAVCVYDHGNTGGASLIKPMTLDEATGIWSFTGDSSLIGKYYRYVVDVYVRSEKALKRNLVTDPYSVSLSGDSQRSWIGTLDQASVKPAGWDAHAIPALAAAEDLSIYELHVRDFSAKDESVPTNHRGKYLAFADESAGMDHLSSLQAAGLSMIHLLPINDIGTIPERDCVSPVIADDAPDAESQQSKVSKLRDNDCFNWGYDPLHYTAIEGSYATNPSDATVRVKEFRQAVQALHAKGLRVALDVVYNHTPASGQNPKSILDRVVPGYYHRLDTSGNVTNSTCCANTATENKMMGKLMIDSVATLAREYKIDAFRFDLMGHQPLAVMNALQAAVNAAAGRDIYLYGEGWNFGEVINNTRFVQATQRNLAGSGIGSFNDRIRDALRGGGAFDGGEWLVRNQGLINGIYLDDNGAGGNKTEGDLRWVSDMVRIGLAATLADYEMTASDGNVKRGDHLDYYGQGAGYTLDPQEVINYADKHDNQTLFDINGYKLPWNTTMADRVRVQQLGIASITLAQGVPFYHGGMDILRSKSYDRDSYNSGDHFNAIDWSLVSNNYGVGAPVAEKNADNWGIIKPRLANAAMKPDAVAAARSTALFREWLQIRKSSTLFRLRTGADVKSRMTLLNTGTAQVNGVVGYVVDGDDYAGANYSKVVVLANVDKNAHTITAATLTGTNFELHPVLQDSVDSVVQTASVDNVSGSFTVPARTVAVFVSP